MRLLGHTLFLGLSSALMIAAVASPARADKCTDLKEHTKPAIPFVPVDRTNPATGLPYEPGWMIEVAGTQMRADQAFDAIDNLERSLTSHGYTLRGSDPETLAELGVCPELLTSQAALMDMVFSDPAGPLASQDSVAAKIKKAIDKGKDKIPSWDEILAKAKDTDREVYLPKVPTYTAPIPTPKRSALKPLFKERSWAWEMGEKDNLWTQVQASFRIDGSKTAAKTAAKGTINASVLGLWEGEALGAEANADIGDTHIAGLSVNVRVVGKSVFSKNWSKNWTDGPFQEHDEKSFDTRKEVSYRFAIGPFPCKGTVGFIGQAGIKYGFDIVPIQISAFAVPFAATKAFAQVGVDIVVASAGVGGDLTLINDDVTLQGGVSLTFEDDPTLTLELTGKNKIEALSGKLYAFAKVGLCGLSSHLCKEWRFTIFSWPGYKNDADLFKFRTTWGPSGITVEGDATAEDVMEVTADTQERRIIDLENKTSARAFEVFDAIAKDLNSAAAAAVQAEKIRHDGISKAIDDTITAYWAELARSGA